MTQQLPQLTSLLGAMCRGSRGDAEGTHREALRPSWLAAMRLTPCLAAPHQAGEQQAQRRHRGQTVGKTSSNTMI